MTILDRIEAAIAGVDQAIAVVEAHGADRVEWQGAAGLQLAVARLNLTYAHAYLTGNPRLPRIRNAVTAADQALKLVHGLLHEQSWQASRKHVQAGPTAMGTAINRPEWHNRLGLAAGEAKRHIELALSELPLAAIKRQPCPKCDSKLYLWTGPTGCSECGPGGR